jgi:hypothetical protein
VGFSCYKILCGGFLSVPLPVGMHLKVSPKGHHIFDWLSYPTAFKHSGSDARESGLITQHPILAVSLIFGVPKVRAHDTTSEQSILEETLEGTLHGTPQVHKVVLYVPLLLVDFLVEKGLRSLNLTRPVSSETRHS